MRALLPFVVTCTIAAACSSVPDVTYDDDDAATADGSASVDSGRDAQPPGPVDASEDASVQPTDEGCGTKSGGEVCCGTSVCDKKDCTGIAALRCSTCARDCAGKRCCGNGIGTSCVNRDEKCK